MADEVGMCIEDDCALKGSLQWCSLLGWLLFLKMIVHIALQLAATLIPLVLCMIVGSFRFLD